MKKIIFILCGSVILGCDDNFEETEQQRMISASKHGIEKHLTYHKDPKTDLCFAAWRDYGPIQIVTNVPCTEKVERLLR